MFTKNTSSVAAMEVSRLDAMLSELSLERRRQFNALDSGLFRQFFDILESPWQMSVLPDFVFPFTRGRRPDDLKQKLMYGQGVVQLAAEDPAIHKLFTEVTYLLKTQKALMDKPVFDAVMARLQPSAEEE